MKRDAYFKLPQPLPIPNVVWRDITMDLMKKLSKSESNAVIMVIMEKFTRYNHFITLSYPFTSKMVVEIFLNYFYKFHDLLAIIIRCQFILQGIIQINY